MDEGRTDGAINKEEPSFLRNFQVQIPFMDGTLESAWSIAKAAVEVMLSGKDTEDIQAEIRNYYNHYAVYPFLDSESNRRWQ